MVDPSGPPQVYLGAEFPSDPQVNFVWKLKGMCAKIRVMEIIDIKNKEEWQDNSQFLQSWHWGEFQQKLGCKIWRWAVKKNKETIVQALVIKRQLPLGLSYLYCPRGPFFGDNYNKEAMEVLVDRVKSIVKKEKAIFFRLEPLKKIEFISSKLRVSSVQPNQTTILDLSMSEDEILKKMHSKTRYNIRLAKRKGVVIQESKNIESFWDLLKQTTQREKFRSHVFTYYQKLLDCPFTKLYLARYKNKTLSAHLIIFFNQTVFYVHGGSSREFQQVMAPHLLHWYVIKEAQKKGYKFYDFWGIDERKWPGFTKFKMSFGGEKIVYPGTFDLPFSSFWYTLYKAGKFIR